MAQQVKSHQSCKVDNWSLIPRSHGRSGELTPRLSSDLPVYMTACVYLYYLYTKECVSVCVCVCVCVCVYTPWRHIRAITLFNLVKVVAYQMIYVYSNALIHVLQK